MYNGAARWQLFFSTPNEAGLFVLLLIPVVWGLMEVLLESKRLVSTIVSACLQATLLYILDRTMSRGSAVGLLCAFGIYFGLASLIKRTRRGSIIIALITLSLATLILFLGSLHSRFSPNTLIHDRSVGNRFQIWKGGLEMLAASPSGGWSAAGTGWHYAQWFRPTRDSAYANNLVSGVLEFGASRGAVLLALALLPFCLAGAIAIRCHTTKCSQRDMILARVGAPILGAFLCANIFSSLYQNILLVTLPAGAVIATIILLIQTITASKTRRSLVLLSCASSAVAVLALLICGFLFQRRSSASVALASNYVTLKLGSSGDIIVVPDSTVLGANYGWEIRSALNAAGFRGVARVCLPESFPTEPTFSTRGSTVLFGRYAPFAPLVTRGDIIIVHPTSKPPALNAEVRQRIRSVVVPTFDATCDTRAWEVWATSAGVRLLRTPYGKDITASFSEYLPYLLP